MGLSDNHLKTITVETATTQTNNAQETEKQQYAALDIVKDIRTSILYQGFGIQNRLHYDLRFHSILYNGVGTVINLYVYYNGNVPNVRIEITHNDKIMVFNDADYERSATEYEKFFEKIHAALIQKFSIGYFEVDFYTKKKRVY